MSASGDLRYLCGTEAAGGSTLGRVIYGLGGGHADADLQVPMDVLPEGGLRHTSWLSSGTFREAELEGCRYRAKGELLFAWIRLAEADFAARADATPLQQASRAAYERLFRVLAETGYPQLVRCWNYLPDINFETSGLERYRQFNIGRQDAFLASGRSCLENLPAASALGIRGDALYLYCIASRVAPQAIENPRQLSAFLYPERYGPRSPSFARASLLGGEALFISGTASIVGHESLHAGDVRAQTLETLDNIGVLVDEANRLVGRGAFSLAGLDFKVFVRHPVDQPLVAAAMRERLGRAPRALFVQADVCRAELLVEIEAFGSLERLD